SLGQRLLLLGGGRVLDGRHPRGGDAHQAASFCSRASKRAMKAFAAGSPRAAVTMAVMFSRERAAAMSRSVLPCHSTILAHSGSMKASPRTFAPSAVFQVKLRISEISTCR